MFTFETTNENSVGYYQKAYTDRTFSIQDFVSHCVKEAGYDLQFEGTSLGRIDLMYGDVVALDFTLDSKVVGEGTNGRCLGGESISTGIWGNEWIVSMCAMTTSGNRNYITNFKFTQPMLSRYKCSTSDTNVKKRHTKLVKDHLERCVGEMISFLKHYIPRVLS